MGLSKNEGNIVFELLFGDRSINPLFVGLTDLVFFSARPATEKIPSTEWFKGFFTKLTNCW
jgi:hypothetical protein